MIHPYIIVDDHSDHVSDLRAMASGYPNLEFVGSAKNYDDAIELILEKQPAVVFLEIDPQDPENQLSLHLVNETFRYMKVPPKFIVTTASAQQALQALRFEVFDYLLKPLSKVDFRKAIFRLDRMSGGTAPVITLPIVLEEPKKDVAPHREPDPEDGLIAVQPPTPLDEPEEKPLVICVKSYGDYRFINADEIAYLQADNNSTDIHLNNGEMITAFKTLKHFENVLQSPFVRIHNSYIVNIDYVSRIHTGNSVCYIKNSAIKLPFSKSYKENIDSILETITNGNYLEI